MQHSRLAPAQMVAALGPSPPRQPGIVWLTVLRDPTEVFLSQWEYYQLQKHYNMTLGRCGRTNRKPFIITFF